jgi:hypothetical protein
MDQSDDVAFLVDRDQPGAYRTKNFNFRKEVFIQLHHAHFNSNVLHLYGVECSLGTDNPS